MSALRVINKPSPSSLASNDNAIFKTGGKTIYNVYNLAGQLIHVNQVNGDTTSDYVSLNERSVVRLRKVGNDAHTPSYIYAYHVGSPVGQSIGSVSINIIRERYTSFCIAMDNPSQLDDQGGFTPLPWPFPSIIGSPNRLFGKCQPPSKQIKDKVTDLNKCNFRSRKIHNMQARYYDPVIGRFLSIDPVTFMGSGSGSDTRYFNRYAYAGNDPVNNLDRYGRQITSSTNFGSTLREAGCGASCSRQVLRTIGPIIADFTPVVGSIKGGIEFANDPSLVNAVGIIAYGKLLKRGGQLKHAVSALEKQGFNKVEIDGDTFVQKTFETSSGNINFAAKVGGDADSLKLDELQIFRPTEVIRAGPL